MNQARLNLTKSRDMIKPTYYVTALLGEYSQYAFDEERAPVNKGVWRERIFECSAETPMDVEIGTGNGFFFAHQVAAHPERRLVGIEIKFKPLIQTIRRALDRGAVNGRVVRYHAAFIEHLFSVGEINDIYVHHPDPWEKRRKHKHRLLNRDYLNKLHQMQRPGSFIDFKTDSRDYFFWAVEEFKNTPYRIDRYTEDLHRSEWSHENVVTHFEKIFIKQGLPIYYLRAFTGNV